MRNLILVAALACIAVNARAQWAGKLDMSSPPSFGAWQSVTSAEQAVGLTRRAGHLDYGQHVVTNAGVFIGVSKPALTEPSSPARPLGGFTFAVPGSTLDWALGTDWGARWAPRLKTGLLFAYDLTRVNALRLRPNFVGVGATYPWGSAP